MKTFRCRCNFVAFVICFAVLCGFSQTIPRTNSIDDRQNTAANLPVESSHDEQLYGKWIFDRDFSFLQLTNSNPADWPKAPHGVPDWAAPTPYLVFSQFTGVTCTITTNEIIVYEHGMAHTNAYEILKRPSPNEIMMKMENSSTNDMRFLKGRMELDVNLGFKLYFSRYLEPKQ